MAAAMPAVPGMRAVPAAGPAAVDGDVLAAVPAVSHAAQADC